MMRYGGWYGLVVLVAVSLGSAAAWADCGSCPASAEKKPACCSPAGPAFTLQDHNGNNVNLADYKGKVVVLEWWNEGCPYTQRHAKAGTMKNLAEKYREQGVVWLAINSTSGSANDSNRQSVAKYALNYPILNDADGAVGKKLGAKTTPHMFVIDKEGQVAYSGAIDNDPNGDKSDRVNYVQQAVEQLLAGNAVSVAETKPYGCGVKYAK